MSESNQTSSTQLRCCRGEAPEGLPGDLQRVLDLPEDAQQEFWTVLRTYLKPEMSNRFKRESAAVEAAAAALQQRLAAEEPAKKQQLQGLARS